MRLFKTIVFIALLITSVQCRAQNGLDLGYDFCTDTIVTSPLFGCYADTNYFFVTGATLTLGVSPEHGTLASFNYDGSLRWYKKLFFPGYDNSSPTYNGLIKIDSDKYMMTAININHNVIAYDVWQPYFYTFNSNGDSIRYTAFDDDTVHTKTFTGMVYQNGCITAVGVKNYPPSGASLRICKYDTTGKLIWEKEYMKGNLTNINNADLALSADRQHMVLAGDGYDTSTGILGSLIMKMDTSGHMIWLKSLRKTYWSNDNNVDVVANPTGGYYFVSSINTKPADSPLALHIYYGKLDENGDTVWTRTFQSEFRICEGRKIAWTRDHQHLVLLVGPYSGTRSGAIKIDTLGNVAWYHMYFHHSQKGNTWGALRCLSVTPDDRYLMAGTVDSLGKPFNDTLFYNAGNMGWMVLTDSNGCRYPGDPACWPLAVKELKS